MTEEGNINQKETIEDVGAVVSAINRLIAYQRAHPDFDEKFKDFASKFRFDLLEELVRDVEEFQDIRAFLKKHQYFQQTRRPIRVMEPLDLAQASGLESEDLDEQRS